VTAGLDVDRPRTHTRPRARVAAMAVFALLLVLWSLVIGIPNERFLQDVKAIVVLNGTAPVTGVTGAVPERGARTVSAGPSGGDQEPPDSFSRSAASCSSLASEPPLSAGAPPPCDE